MKAERIGVFCGSHAGKSAEYAAAAREFGRELARRGLSLVYGGGRIGLMGVLADAALAAGARVTGVIPRGLATRRLAHDGLTEIVMVNSLAERKAELFARSDALAALPGGLGTLDELVEALTAAQLGLLRKPCGLLNVRGYFDPLLVFLRQAAEKGFVSPEHAGMVQVAERPAELLDALSGFKPPAPDARVPKNGLRL